MEHELFELNCGDLVSCIDTIINEDIGTLERYPEGCDEEYEKDFKSLSNGTNDKLLDEICDYLISNSYGVDPMLVNHYKKCGAIKLLAAFFAKIQLDIWNKSKTDHSYMGPKHIDLSIDL